MYFVYIIIVMNAYNLLILYLLRIVNVYHNISFVKSLTNSGFLFVPFTWLYTLDFRSSLTPCTYTLSWMDHDDIWNLTTPWRREQKSYRRLEMEKHDHLTCCLTSHMSCQEVVPVTLRWVDKVAAGGADHSLRWLYATESHDDDVLQHCMTKSQRTKYKVHQEENGVLLFFHLFYFP